MEIKWVYGVDVDSFSCPHLHRTRKTAEACLRRHIRAAAQGKIFYGCDSLLKFDLNEPGAIERAIRIDNKEEFRT